MKMGKKRHRIKPLKSKPVYPPGEAEAKGIVSVTRIAALVRVLDTAIWMWAMEKDPLPIHLLVMSQYQCLQDICRKRGIEPFAAQFTDPSRRTIVYDFLKHASSNPFGGVDFDPMVNWGFLYDAVCTFQDLFARRTAYMDAFVIYIDLWFPRSYPQFGHPVSDSFPKGVTVADFNSLSRKGFFAKLIKALREDAIGGVHIESP